MVHMSCRHYYAIHLLFLGCVKSLQQEIEGLQPKTYKWRGVGGIYLGAELLVRGGMDSNSKLAKHDTSLNIYTL